MNRSLHWFRRDLRLKDNRAFFEATNKSQQVATVFVFDENILSKLNHNKDPRVQIIFDGLMELKDKIRAKGSDLIIIKGDPLIEIPKWAKKLGVDAVYTNEDYEPYAIARDQKVSKELEKTGIEFNVYKDHVIFRGDEILKKDRTPYKVFTPYKNEWLRTLTPQDLGNYKANLNRLIPAKDVKHKEIKSLEDISFLPCGTIQGGEKKAHSLLNSFLKRIHRYHNERDQISLDSNSSLSPYLRFGMISTRELVRKTIVLDGAGPKTWLSEIIWREFYQMILYQFPSVVKNSFNAKYNDIKWPGKTQHLKRWMAGETGYPLIDAAMRHFAKTGKMHNRLRMVVACFLVKDLLIDWKKGEMYFAEKLLDFDLASNNGGWQWSASTGCDAQPYFRIFNPITQSKRFDPNGEFIKKHLPELKNFSHKDIHFPAECSLEKQKAAGAIIGKDYPKPIVDHANQRILAVNLFKMGEKK